MADLSLPDATWLERIGALVDRHPAIVGSTSTALLAALPSIGSILSYLGSAVVFGLTVWLMALKIRIARAQLDGRLPPGDD
jgi:hypothetical protein